jgi:predicted nucleotidyltransferase
MEQLALEKLNLNSKKRELLKSILSDLEKVDGIMGLVLGGSYALGLATEDSDLDIGLYYSSSSPFSIHEIKLIAKKYADKETPVVTNFYEWGPWVNGGAWIKNKLSKIDFLYKNIEQITTTIENAHQGNWEVNYEQQPPFGFSSLIFLAETFYCVPLYERNNCIQNLKEKVSSYPDKLKQAVVQQSLWAAEFTIYQAIGFAEKEDIYNTYGCYTRAINKIILAIFALNERYPMGDKRALIIIDQLTLKPENLSKRIEEILHSNKANLKTRTQLIKNLHGETVSLANGLYTPYYKLQ